MTAQVAFNPYLQSAGNSGLFNVSSKGLRQGTAYPDPATRYALRTGVLDVNETLPMWGGVGIYENIPTYGATEPNATLGPVVGRATALTGSKQIAGFSVFDQAYGMITTPQSNVPLIGSYGQVMSYALGSSARIAVKCAAGLVDLWGDSIQSQVSWDWTTQELVPYAPAYNAVTITGATWANTLGGEATFTIGTDLSAVLTAGDVIDVSGVLSTGATTDGYNGNWVVVSVPDSSHVIVLLPRATTPGTYASGGTIAAAGGALPVKVLDIQAGNCMTVDYDADTGFANYDFDGNCAVIQLTAP